MGRARRPLRWMVGAIAALALLIAVASILLLTTRPGARLAVNLIADRLPVALMVADVRGRLIGPLELIDARLVLDGVDLEADELVIAWRPLAILRRRVHLESVRIHGFRITVQEEGKEAAAPDAIQASSTSPPDTAGIALPIEVILDALQLRDGSLSIPEVLEARDITLQASGTLESYKAEIEAAVELLDFPAMRLGAAGSGTLNGIVLRSTLTGALKGELRTWGSVSWKPQLTWDIEVEGDTLVAAAVAPNPEEWPGRLSLRGRTRGRLEADRPLVWIEVDTLQGSLRRQPLAGRLSGGIDGSEYELATVSLDWGNIRIAAQGGLSPERLALDFTLDVPDMGAALPRSSGSVTASGKLSGSPSAPQVKAALRARELTVDRFELDSVRALVDVDWAERSRNEVQLALSGLRVANLVLDSLSLMVQGSKEGHQLDARIASERADVELRATGALRGESWKGEIQYFSLETARVGDWRLVDAVRLDAGRRAVDLGELCLADEDARLCVTGSWGADDSWRLSSSLEQVPLEFIGAFLPGGWSASGKLSGSAVAAGGAARVEVAAVELRSGPAVFGHMGGARETVLSLAESEIAIHLDPDSLSGDIGIVLADSSGAAAGVVTASAHLPPVDALTRKAQSEGLVEALSDDGRLSITIEDVLLSLMDEYLPQGISFHGSLNGALSARALADGSLAARLEVVPDDVSLVRAVGEEVRILRFVEPTIEARADAGGVRGHLSLAVARPDSAPHAILAIDVALPEYTNLAQPIGAQSLEAEVTGSIDLSLVDAVLEDISNSQGRLEIDLAARGTVSDPDYSGEYRLSGDTDVPGLGIQLRDIELTAEAAREGVLDITGGLVSGDGRLEIVGTAPIIPSPDNPGRLLIRGERFLAAQTDQVSLIVSPSLEIQWTGTAIDVTGEVTIPRATIEILEIPETPENVSKDVVLVGGEEGPRRPLDIFANIRLVLGDEILFKGFGITTNIEGSIQMTEQPDVGTRGRGELVLREGTYRGYGQNLTIDPGRLVFAGPVDDPGVEVRAYRRASDGTRAGFTIGGTLKSLDVQVWSEPIMSESAALSYVLFGRSAEQGSEAERQQAGNAAALLGGNILAAAMAQQVGLDEARIETGARQEDAAFFAGKYLSPKLYVAYGVGLFEPIEVIRVRYLISRRFTLQAETGSRDSGDILFRIER
ncbi:MAG: translocation/assembly module TamB domain-containing protein [Gemmatimonadota bacterium]|nr:MAG: translocation/assembly module TamB domain-containing protein [Gemmatimonadota bacterium]